MSHTLASLTDDEIIAQCSGSINSARDYDLNRVGNPPRLGGLFDPVVFGSLERCKPGCGRTTKYNKYCSKCGYFVTNVEGASKRIGYFTLSYPVVSETKILALVQNLVALHPVFAPFGCDPISGRKSKSANTLLRSLWNHRMVYTQVANVDESSGNFYVTRDGITFRVTVAPYYREDSSENFREYGATGLRNFLYNYKIHPIHKKDQSFIAKYVNQVVPVSPITWRPAQIRTLNGRKKLRLHPFNTFYTAIIRLDEIMTRGSDKILVKSDKSKSFKIENLPLADILTFLFTMNRLVNTVHMKYTLMKSSKYSLVRNMYSRIVKKSGRANIVGDPTLPIDTIKIPRQMAYESLKGDIMRDIKARIKDGTDPTITDEFSEYENPGQKTMENFEALVARSCVLFVRNPTLQKYNVSAFKVKLWEEISIGMPLLSTPLFNADFDGDTMAYFFVTDPVHVEQSLRTQGVENNWYFEKSGSPIFAPNAGILKGLYLSTLRKNYNRPVPYFEGFDAMAQAYEKDFTLKVNEVCRVREVDEIETTYGRWKISQILGMPLDEVIKSDETINGGTIGRVMCALNSKSDKVERLHKLQRFAEESAAYVGATSISLSDIYQITEMSQGFRVILESNQPEEVKARLLQQKLPEIMEEQIKVLSSQSDSFNNIIKGSGKIKPAVALSLLGPRIEVTPSKGVVVHDGTLATGFDEEAFVSHSTENREILKVKKEVIPVSGYLARQLIDMAIDIQFTEQPSKSTKGIVMRQKDAEGRVIIGDLPNGMVRVKSCVDGENEKVAREELSSGHSLTLYNEDLTVMKVEPFSTYVDGQAIGISFASSIVEEIVQGGLALKHGGALTIPSMNKLESLTAGRVTSIQSKFIIVTDDEGTAHMYPKPPSLILCEETDGRHFDKGTILGFEDRWIRVEEKLADIFKFMNSFSKVQGIPSVNSAFCYAPDSGVITYDLVKNRITIGKKNIPYRPDALYKYPEGTAVNKGDRICTGTISLNTFHNVVGDMGWTFFVFKDQIEHILGKRHLYTELYEVIFKAICGHDFSIRAAHTGQKKWINEIHHGAGRQSIIRYIDKDIGTGMLTRLLLGE